MRFVIFGAGAVGGVVGARLHQSGREVVLIARGAHHDAIASHGLTLRSPDERVQLPLPVATGPAELAPHEDDVVLLATKSQDTVGAVDALVAAGWADVAIACLQNGVENERVALRRLRRVYGAVVMVPSGHLEPGVVLAHGTRMTGAIDIGRYPGGVDERAAAVCEALRVSGFESESREDIMRYKHAKLINNLRNVVDVVCGLEADAGELGEELKAEGRSVLSAAGIPHQVEGVSDAAARFERWGIREIPDVPHHGSSTWQSAVRGGRLETDYLNGEIVLRARQHGVPAPLNALMTELARETERAGHEPGWLTPREVFERVGS